MRVGVPREIKVHEYRVGLTPAGAAELVQAGHEVFVETKAGDGVGFADSAYEAVGAKILPDAEAVFKTGELIVKVKEPQPIEYARLTPEHTLFTYLHLAPDPDQTKGLMDSGCIAIAYETVTDNEGRLPLLKPMSEVAGRMSIQVGATALEKSHGGRGMLLGGVPGVQPAKVVILGGGVSGTHAAEMAVGMRADVTIFDRSIKRLAELDTQFQGRAKTAFSTAAAVEEAIIGADLVIGAVLIPGAAAPKLVTRDMLKKMKDGAVLVDIAIDQGGCFETSKPTTHQSPTFIVDGVVHYCVANMPGAVARTSTIALTNATLPFTLAIANKGAKKAMNDDPHLARGLNVAEGHVTYEPVARDLGHTYVKPDWLKSI
ncbi:MAG TPA: alanine dehydrogenase [Oceanicaulis sp.]|jgi:alanine dehydrogenase|uniref:Alanine dehydrogenase n=1 Tax=Glycocaulis albus TaxID=1382801 RepID=A0ABQ1XMA1_9PROT|nr:alanine dehydrogenase [Glycocaulis albus]GGG97638.1 alanine dehydrogenase [Glycocaulis albus]HCY55417.1 alanine dehydrogenase [Oceanicaulis sp.]